MRRLILLFFLLSLRLPAQTLTGMHARGMNIGTEIPPLPPSTGLVFTPGAGSYSNTQFITITNNPNSVDIMYTSDGTPATEASLLFSTAIPVASTTTLNALAISAPTVLNQNTHQCNTSTCWKTQLACTKTQCSPYVSSFNSPNLAYGSGVGCNNGVCGIPTAIGFDLNKTTPLSTKGTNLWFTTQNIAGAGGQTQVLWANRLGAADNATYQVEDFWEFPDPVHTGVTYARESDLVNWILSRHINLSGALQCNLGAATPHWQYNGQQGSWNDFGDVTNVYKNGVLVQLTPKITEGCTQAIPSTGYHIRWRVSFLPNAKHCTDVNTGLATECSYVDYLAINNDIYTFGTQTVTDGSGNNVVTSALTTPGAVLPAGTPSRCFFQLQLDTAGKGASASNPISYGYIVDQVNESCGGGTPTSTGSAAYTLASSYPVTIPVTATAYTGLEQLSGWIADADSSISPNPPTTYTINQTGTPVVMTLDTVGTSGLYTGWMAHKGVTTVTGLNQVLRATYKFDSVSGIQAWEVGRRRTNAAQVTDNGQTQLVPKSGGVLEFDIVPSASGGWVDTGCRFPTFVIGTLYTEELYYVNDSDGALSLKYVELNGTTCPIPSNLQHIAGSVQSPPWAANVSTMAFQPDANKTAVPYNATVTLSAWVW